MVEHHPSLAAEAAGDLLGAVEVGESCWWPWSSSVSGWCSNTDTTVGCKIEPSLLEAT